MADGFLRGASARWMALVAILLAGILMPQSAQAAPSVYCPTLNASVSNGGSVAIEVSSCDGPFDGGMSGPIAPFAQHGTVTIGSNSGGTQFVTYAHSGNAATSDQFSLEDNDLGVVTVNITITPPASPIAVSPGSLPALTAGTPFSQALTSTGGTAPYTYTLQGGALPVGLSLTSNGLISGTPAQRGGYAFVVRSTDNIGQFVDKGYTGTVQNPTLSITPTSATATQGVVFSQTLSASGGVAPYSYQVESGLLPPGISLSSSGLFSGTTSAAPGSYPLVLRVTDSSTGPGVYFELENFTLNVAASPSVSISVSPASVTEDGAATMVYTLTRSANLASSTIVNMTRGGTATSGTDYTGATTTVTIPGGATSAIIVIDPVADGDIEADETVVLTVVPGSGYTIATPSSATGTILNDDRPTVSISVSPAQVTEDGVAELVYTATLDQPALTALAINYIVGGTATNSDDYYATIASPIIIPAGSISATVVVDPIPDVTTEADETVVLTLAAGSGYDVGTPNSATGTIENDDLPTLTINNASFPEGDSGTQSIPFTISLSSPAGPGGVTFDIATANGTATAGSDFAANSLTGQTIPAGSSTHAFSVDISGDMLNEADETFFVNVTNVANAILGDGQGVGTIVNDDALPSLSIDDVSVVEGGSGTTNAVFTVNLSSASGRTVTVNYATADGTATQVGDYTGVSGGLSFVAGETVRTITIPVIGDTAPEADETFFVNLSGAVNASVSDGQGVGTIVNDDVPVTLSPTSLPGGTVAAAYSQTVAASGGTAPYSYGVTAGTLPAGLTLSAGGALSGTPSAGGTFGFTITATDSSPLPGPFSGSQAYSLTIAPPTLTLPPMTLAQGQMGAAYSAAIAPATGGTAPYSYAVTAGALPTGITLSASGVLSGTPGAFGTFNFSITATDSSTGTGPYSTTQSYALTIDQAAPVAGAVSATIAYGSSGNAITLNLSGGTATSVAVATTPSHGTAIASGTSITYTPDAGYAGADSFTYTASNAGGTSAPATASITVGDPSIGIAASGPLTTSAGVTYNQSFAFSGGAQPFSAYQVTGLPAGLSVTGTTANSVAIGGTPTQSGSFTLNVSATDNSTGNGPFTSAQNFLLDVNSPVLAMTPAAGALNVPYGAAFTQSFNAAGGVGPYSYAISGALPSGLSFTGDMLSGTPTVPGSYPISVTATDMGSTGPGSPFTITQNYVIDVPAPTIVVTPASISDAAIGTNYSQNISASGGAGSYSFSVTAGALPAGLTLSPAGALSGTPTAGGSFSFTVTATDDFGRTGAQAYNMAVTSPTLTLPSATLMQGQKGIAYSDAIGPAVGGTAPYSYAITAGALPAGITLSASGALSGTPSIDGTFNFSVTATDSSTGAGPYSATQSYALTIIEASPVTGAVAATVAYNSGANAVTLNLSGGAAASVAVATQPANGNASAVGTDISYTPNADFAGTDSFTYTATNAGGTSAPATISITVGDPAISIVASGPLDADVGTPFVQSFVFSGGAQPYTAYQVTGLPAGLSVTGTTANSVSIGGTPVQSGIFTLNVSAADNSTGNGPFTTTQSFSLGIEAPELTMNPASGSFVAPYAEAFTQPLEAIGGIGPYSYALSGTLPTGITLDADTGTLSGTATVVGNFAFTVTATDTGSMNGAGAPFKVQGDYTLEVAAPAIDITPPTLPTGTANSAYNAALAASGAVAPYSFALSGGTLPTGISLASDGRISGTPTAAGDFAFTVTATDSNGQTGTANFTLTIGNAVLTITPDTLPAGIQGMAYSQQLSTTGGIAPYSYAVSDGELPAGLTLGTGSGLISGTPTGSGVSTFIVRVTDSTGGTPSTRDINYTLTVAARPNPANDPEVRGLVQAQVNGARRLVETQIGNFGRRLEGMRRGGEQGGIQNGLRLSSADRCTDTMTAWTNSVCANSGPNGWNNRPGGSGPMGLGGNLMASGVPVGGAAIGGTSPGEDRNAAAGAEGAQDLPWTLWAGGTIRYGDRDEATGRPSQRFESEGVTFGADYRFNPAFAAGIGIGLGRESSDVGRNGTRSRGEAKTLAIYGSHLLGRGIYFDWLAGHQWLDFDLRRYVTLTGDVVNSSRKGRQWFGSLSAGADIETGDWRFTPYARLDAQRGTLDGYTEESGSVFDLTFLDHDIAFTSIGAGAKIDYQLLVENGYFIPRIRIEYQRDIERDGRALVAYFDQTSGPFNVIPIVGYSRSRLLFGAGMEMVMGERTAVDVEYSHRRNGDTGSDQGVLVNITQAF